MKLVFCQCWLQKSNHKACFGSVIGELANCAGIQSAGHLPEQVNQCRRWDGGNGMEADGGLPLFLLVVVLTHHSIRSSHLSTLYTAPHHLPRYEGCQYFSLITSTNDKTSMVVSKIKLRNKHIHINEFF